MPAPASLLNSPTYSSTSTDRLKALYSDFSRKKQSNPSSYEANIEWWWRTLESYLGEGIQGPDALVLHVNAALMENLRIEGVGRPIGLNTVMAELATSSSPPAIIPASTFLTSPTSIYASRSAFSYVAAVPSFVLSYGVAKPLWWALEQVGVVGEDSIASSVSSAFSRFSSSASKDDRFGDYVMLGLIERAGESVIELQRQKAAGPGDALYSVEGFRREFARCIPGARSKGKGDEGALMSELDMKVLLKYLARDKGAVVVDKEVVKFTEPYALAEQTREITMVDRGIVELKNAVDNLRRQILAIQTKMEQCTSKASEALRQNRKPLALSYLRSRRQLEDVLKKRLGALDNLEGTLVQVESAAGDIEIVKAYGTSTETLKALLSHPFLQRESVEKTMEAMADANADARELDDAIRIGGDVAVGVGESVDEDEIASELEQLVRENQADSEMAKLKEKLDGVSSVPQQGTGKDTEEEGPQRERVLAA